MPLTGFDEFKEVFGSITVLSVVELLLAVLFCYLIYRKLSKYLIGRYGRVRRRTSSSKPPLTP